jgi:hypothetical protein
VESHNFFDNIVSESDGGEDVAADGVVDVGGIDVVDVLILFGIFVVIGGGRLVDCEIVSGGRFVSSSTNNEINEIDKQILHILITNQLRYINYNSIYQYLLF